MTKQKQKLLDLLETIIETQRKEHECGMTDSYAVCGIENEVEVFIHYQIIKTLNVRKLFLILHAVKIEFDYRQWWNPAWNFEIAMLKKEIINKSKEIKNEINKNKVK